MKLGLFGGTFNPVHFGHVKVATEVHKCFCFDRMYFIPSRIPPHKGTGRLASSGSRCEMILKSLPKDLPFSLSRIELDRSGPSYAIDTINYFRSKSLPRDRLFFILGMDAFLELHTWKSYEKLIELSEFIVMSRVDKCSNRSFDNLDVMRRYIPMKLSSRYYFCASGSFWKHKRMKLIHYVKVKSPDISSTQIRNSIKLGKNFRHFLPLTVADYITEKGLYSWR